MKYKEVTIQFFDLEKNLLDKYCGETRYTWLTSSVYTCTCSQHILVLLGAQTA